MILAGAAIPTAVQLFGGNTVEDVAVAHGATAGVETGDVLNS